MQAVDRALQNNSQPTHAGPVSGLVATDLVYIPCTKRVQKASTISVNASFCTPAPGGATVGVVDCGHQLLADSVWR
jgi:hypothetical protein